jgi:hypothetical protein
MLAARMDVLCSNLASDVVLAIGTMAIVQMAVIDALLIAFFL